MSPSCKIPPRPSNKRPPLFQNFQNKRPPRINAPPPPPKGEFNQNILLFPGKEHVYTLFELLDENIVEAAPSFNLIDEENDDKKLEIL